MNNNSLKEKFKNNILVKPLYKKVDHKVSPQNLLVSISVDHIYKLEGNEINVKRQVISDLNGEVFKNLRNVDVDDNAGDNNFQEYDNCKVKYNSGPKPVFLSDNLLRGRKMTDSAESDIHSDNFPQNTKTNKFVQAERLTILKNISDTWLRVAPLPALPKEPLCSVIFRCIICQLGLASTLILWTVIWTFVIQYFEGPYELQVSVDFAREQNQVVIDLATELRQITPLSSKWREAIEKRIEEERMLTILAVGKGARANPGQFWDLPGTFLFTVYVMTALGFGAPVPHTVWGRSSALIYAFVAVPAHIYLMVNASTCFVVKLEACCCRKKKIWTATNEVGEKRTLENRAESQNCSRNSELMKSSNPKIIRKKLLSALCVVCACRCVPLAAVMYYACGAVAFGVLRDQPLVDTLMFPLEFTTTGGLEQVASHVRVLYGLYVEGAMVLISCALATLKRQSTARINCVAENYRLFQVERL